MTDAAPPSSGTTPAGEPELWGVRRTMAVAIPLTVLGFLVAITYFASQDTRLKLSKAKGGECIVLPSPYPAEGSALHEMHQRDCDKNHNAEIYAVFKYPGTPAAGSPTPTQNCREAPAGLGESDAARFRRFMTGLVSHGGSLLELTDNADATADRHYACIVTFPDRHGRFLDVVSAAAATGP